MKSNMSYATVIKAGGSYTLSALTQQINALGLRRGDKVHVYVENGKIVIEKT